MIRVSLVLQMPRGRTMKKKSLLFPVPANVDIHADGTTTVRSPAASSVTLPNLPAPEGPLELGAEATAHYLDTIFSRWPGSAGCYLPFYQLYPLAIVDAAMSRREEMLKGSRRIFQFPSYHGSMPHGAPPIYTTIPPGFENSFYNQRCEIFVVLDGFGNPVPAMAADIFCGAFASGLATRLLLQNYFDQWYKKGAPNNGASIDVDAAQIQIPGDFLIRANYSGDTEASFTEV